MKAYLNVGVGRCRGELLAQEGRLAHCHLAAGTNVEKTVTYL